MLSAFKNFGVTFLISAFLFGIIAYFATGFVASTVGSILEDEHDQLSEIIENPEEDPDNATDPDADLHPGDDNTPEGESFNFLIVTTDYRPDLYNDYAPTVELMNQTDWSKMDYEDTTGCLSTDYRDVHATSIVLVRIDKETRQFVYTYFTPQIRVFTSTGHHTLGDLYTLYGMNGLVEHIGAMTGLQMKYTLLLNGYNIAELADLLGSVTVNTTKNIYTDGKYYTMQYETTEEKVGPNGGTWTEHTPNTYLLSAGNLNLDGETLYMLSSILEHSSAELAAKQTYTLAITRAYVERLAAMEDIQMKMNLAKLIMNESEWASIEEMAAQVSGETKPESETPEFETEETIESATDETSEDDETAQGNDETVDPEESEEETEEEETLSPWLVPLSEPTTPIVETKYTMNEYDDIADLIRAAAYFEHVIITYPCEYTAADEDNEEHFKANVTKGIDLYLKYRLIAREEDSLPAGIAGIK